MATNYDKLAGSYDLIRQLVFGNSIVRAQVCLLQYITAGNQVLIVGGGTGWILEEIAKVVPAGLVIDYVESSGKMILLAKKRKAGNNEINFIHQPVEAYSTEKRYDVILTPFLFDNFSTGKIGEIFGRLDEYLAASGTWLYADFVYDKDKGHLWQKYLLRIMYLFFRLTCNIETQYITDMKIFFGPLYDEIFAASFYAGFIRSAVYKKRKLFIH